jgi:hypothetical protein
LSEQTRSALASELGEERLAVALAVGREMTFEEGMAYALQNQTQPHPGLTVPLEAT